VQETTALGAAYLAGLATGVWASTDEITSRWALDRSFEPGEPHDALYEQWKRAVARAQGWAT
jgi:glycerol kinase